MTARHDTCTDAGKQYFGKAQAWEANAGSQKREAHHASNFDCIGRRLAYDLPLCCCAFSRCGEPPPRAIDCLIKNITKRCWMPMPHTHASTRCPPSKENTRAQPCQERETGQAGQASQASRASEAVQTGQAGQAGQGDQSGQASQTGQPGHVAFDRSLLSCPRSSTSDLTRPVVIFSVLPSLPISLMSCLRNLLFHLLQLKQSN